jgi:phospholipase D1/2
MLDILLLVVNERSMRGDRDSELASVIRDTDMIDSRMAGKPFKVGRFAHTLRMRLMRGAFLSQS